MRTTLTIEDVVAAKLKSEMRKSGKSFKETVNETLRLGFINKNQVEPPKPFKVKARLMGLRPGLSLDNIGELLDQLEGPFHR